MKRVLAVLLCLILVLGSIFTMIACDDETADPNGGANGAHVHTYKTDADWTCDATGHWYEATCECLDVTENKLSHVDDNKDGACDVCKYTDHEHTYSEDWTADCTNHWNAADCGCIVAGANVAAHADGDNDGICDTCKYVIEDLHNHYYDSEWTTDGSYHWHAALCEHVVEVADKAAHEINAAGDCTVCDAHIQDVDMTDIGKVLAAAQANDYKVAFGDVIAKDSVYGGTGAQILENGKTNRVHFALGNGESYIQYISFDMNGNYIGQEEQWHEFLGEDKYFAAAMLYGDYELSPIMGGAQFMNGYNYIPGSIVSSASADTSTLSNILAALYGQMKEGIRVSNATESVENGVYKFAYTYYSINTTTIAGELYTVELELYNVDVEFVMNDDMIISMADFTVEVYRDYENDSDLAYTFDDLGGGEINITSGPTLKATANPSFYEYNVYQLSGERTFTNPYPKASLLPSSFEFYYVLSSEFDDNNAEHVTDYEVIDDYYEVPKDTYAKFCIGEILPVTASTKFMSSDDFHFSFVNNDPESEGRAWYMDAGSTDAMLNGYNAYSSLLKLKLRDPGEYTVTIGFGDVVKVFTLKVVGPEIPEEPESNATQVGVLITDNNAFVDYYEYTAEESGTYTFTVPAGLGFYSKAKYDAYGNPEVEYTGNGGTVSVKLDAGETYGFYVGATEKYTAWVIPVSFVAGEGSGNTSGGDVGGGDSGDTPSGPVDISGTYTGGSITLVINSDGTMVMTNGGIVSNYTYENRNGTYYYSLNGNAEYAGGVGMAQYFGYLVFGTDGMPTAFYYNGSSIALTRTGDAGEGGGDVGGGDVGGGDEPVQDDLKDSLYLQMPTCGSYNLMFLKNDELGYYVNIYNDDFDLYFTYELEEISAGSYAITVTYLARPDFETNPAMAETIEAEVFYAQYDGVDWTFGSNEGGDDEGGDTDALKESLHYTMGAENGYQLWFLTTGGQYLVNIYDSNFDLYFTYVLEAVSDGAYNVIVTYYARPDFETNPAMAETVETYVYHVYYDGSAWSVGAPSEGGDEGEDEIANPAGEYVINDEMSLYFFYADYVDDGVYFMNAYAPDYSWDLYFTFVMTQNSNGTYTIVPTYYARPDYEVGATTEQINAVLDLVYTATYNDGDWTIVASEPLVGSDLEGSGTESDPYVIPEAGDYVCAYPGISYPIWYTYTATANGYITVSTTFGNGGWLLIGTDVNNSYNNNNGGSGEDVKVFVFAGTTYYIGVADYAENVCAVPFTVSFEAKNSDPIDSLVGDWEGNESSSWGGSGKSYTMTINSDGTGTCTVDGGYYQAVYTISFVLVDGNNVTIYMADEYGNSNDLVLTYAAGTLTQEGAWTTLLLTKVAAEVEGSGTAEDAYSASASNTVSVPANSVYVYYTFTAVADGTVTITFTGDNFAWIYGSSAATMTDMHSAATATLEMVTGDVIYIGVTTANGEAGTVVFTIDAPAAPEEPAFDYNTTIVEGENTLYFSADEIAANTATRPLVITTAGNYKFAAGALFISSITDANGTPIAKVDYAYDLVAGEYTVTFGMLSMFGVQADTAQTLNVTDVTPEEPEQPEEPEEPAAPDGTQGNPFVLTETDNTITVENNYDIYVTYTVAKDGVLTIKYPGGSIENLPGGFNKDSAAKTWTGNVTAGQVLNLNLWGSLGGTYTFTLVEAEPEEPAPEGPVLQGSGSQSDPWVIESAPFTYTFTGSHDKYFTFTATEKCTVTVIASPGCSAFGIGSSIYDANENRVYTFVMEANTSITMNAYSTGSADYTYTLTTEAIVEPEQPGEGGGEAVGISATYLSEKHGSGRYLKVEIDAAAGTMNVIRSDMTGNFGTGGQSIAVYTYSFDGTTVTVTNVSGQACTFTWNGDGSPASITWGSAAFTGFTVQA